jgi:hypothetical protein
MGRKRKSGKERGRIPDDYFAQGPLEFARFGRVLIARNNATAAQHAEIQERIAASYPDIVGKIDALVAAIVARVARLPAIRLLHRAWWEHSAAVITRESDSSGQTDALRMIDYVQSVIVSTTPVPNDAEDVSGEEWQALRNDVSALFELLAWPYETASTARRKAEKPDLDMALEEFQVRAELLWMHVRGRRYQLHERQALIDTIAPHSEILMRLFGISAETLVEELNKILTKLTHGLQELFRDLEDFRDRRLARMEEILAQGELKDLDAVREKVFEEPELRDANVRVAGGLMGYDLFDVERNTTLPRSLLDELSYGPGEETEFFAAGEFAGWPLRQWPVMERALNGAPVALFRRGKLVRVEQRRNDRLAIALLGGQWRGGVDDYRRSAVSRRQYFQELKAADAAAAEVKRKAQAIRDQHQAILDALAAAAEHAAAHRIPAVEPRVRKL